jgi:NTE family protein
MSEPRCDVSSGRLRVAVALQGGGSHGAFTWGVLDRLLLEPDLEIVGISGTSAGMNAAILADGLRRGGRSEARAALASYWEDVGGLPGYASFEARSRAHHLPGTSITTPYSSGWTSRAYRFRGVAA